MAASNTQDDPIHELRKEQGISPDFPFQPKTMEIRGSKMSYIDEGQGDPIFFMHGNPTWSYVWRNVIPHLTSHARVIAPDLMGSGRSDKLDRYGFLIHTQYIQEFIDKLGLNRITLVGHDWGSGVIFHIANTNQSKIKGLVFLEALLKTYDTWNDFTSPSADARLRALFSSFRTERGDELVVREGIMLPQMFSLTGRPLSEEEKSRYEEPLKTPKDREVILRWVRDLPVANDPPDVFKAVQSYSEFLCTTRIPKLLLYTNPGAILRKEHQVWCQQNLKYLSMVNLDPSNTTTIQCLMERYPKTIGEAILEWYKPWDFVGSTW